MKINFVLDLIVYIFRYIKINKLIFQLIHYLFFVYEIFYIFVPEYKKS